MYTTPWTILHVLPVPLVQLTSSIPIPNDHVLRLARGTLDVFATPFQHASLLAGRFYQNRFVLVESSIAYLSVGMAGAHDRVGIKWGERSDGLRRPCLFNTLVQGLPRRVQPIIKLEQIAIGASHILG